MFSNMFFSLFFQQVFLPGVYFLYTFYITGKNQLQNDYAIET